MNTNLNVLVKKSILDKAKIRAIEKNTTISKVVRDALNSLIADEEIITSDNNLNSKDRLDDARLEIAKLHISRFTINQIREKSLFNLKQWEKIGTTGPGLDEWHEIMTRSSDQEVWETIIGKSERCVRLRLSTPYVGMIDRREIMPIMERAL